MSSTPSGNSRRRKTDGISAQERRRAAIVETARQLIVETGDVDMRLLAKCSGVSYATPFNLFGSKWNIVNQVSQDDLAALKTDLEQLHQTDPLEKFFDIVTITAGRFNHSLDFYLPLVKLILTQPSTDQEGIMHSRYQFYVPLVEDAQAAGVIGPSFDPAVLAGTLSRIFVAAITEWAVGELEAGVIGPFVCFGFATVLRGATCSQPAADRLGRIIDESQPICAAFLQARKSESAAPSAAILTGTDS
jgi:AcrR family transcriptional regulator